MFLLFHFRIGPESGNMLLLLVLLQLLEGGVIRLERWAGLQRNGRAMDCIAMFHFISLTFWKFEVGGAIFGGNAILHARLFQLFQPFHHRQVWPIDPDLVVPGSADFALLLCRVDGQWPHLADGKTIS